MEHLVFTLVTFVLFTALVGIISGKIVKNSDDQKTAKGYFLAGNGLGGFFIAGSMLLTNLSAENLVGLSGQSYAANMSGMAWEATAVIATIIIYLLQLFLYHALLSVERIIDTWNYYKRKDGSVYETSYYCDCHRLYHI